MTAAGHPALSRLNAAMARLREDIEDDGFITVHPDCTTPLDKYGPTEIAAMTQANVAKDAKETRCPK